MEYKDKVFINKIISPNTIFVYFIFFILLLGILFLSVGFSIYTLCYLIFAFYNIIILSRISKKIEFKKDHCIIYSPPFLKHKHYLNDLTIIVRYEKFIFLKLNKFIIKFPYYVLLLDEKEIKEFISYVQKRNDINIKSQKN